MKEIILFCFGDSNKASTWSNVPFLMAKEFEKQGIKIHRINIAPNRYINGLINRLLKLIVRGGDYTFFRTPLFKFLTNKKIKRAVKRYGSADFCIFLNFDFFNKYNSIPSLLFSDWTYRIFLERINRVPSKIENEFIQQEENAINHADIVLPLFSESVEIMKETYPDANIQSIGYNVINNLDTEHLDVKTLIPKKYESNFILFIGRSWYKEGLESIINSVSELDNQVDVHVIGMQKDQMPKAPNFVKFHGYLKKDDPLENKEYYELMKHAKLIVNPTPKWAGYSSIVEGMYFYNPVIIHPFNQFVKEFGTDIDFGFYNNGSIHELKLAIEKILNMSSAEYSNLAINAHEKVKHYTWENYVSDMIKIMDRVRNNN